MRWKAYFFLTNNDTNDSMNKETGFHVKAPPRLKKLIRDVQERSL